MKKKKMIEFILSIVLVVSGLLIATKSTWDGSTRNYKAVVHLNDEHEHTFIFSTVDQALTMDFLKKKFNYKSNDKMVIVDLVELTSSEKESEIKEIRDKRSETK